MSKFYLDILFFFNQARILKACIIMLLLTSFVLSNSAEAQTNTVLFNNTSDLTTYFNSSSNFFTNVNNGGLSGTGSVNVTGSNDIYTYNTAFSGFTVGETYSVSAYFYNVYDAGYGGLGFAVSSSNALEGFCETSVGIGMFFHSGGGAFINNLTETATSWTNALVNEGDWYKMILNVTCVGVNTFNIDFQIWNSDVNGNLGSLMSENTENGIVNSQIGEASAIYPYFGASGNRFENVDNFSVNGLALQSITFNALSSVTYGSSGFSLSATGGVSGNPVTFTSSDNTIATCSGMNGTTVTIIGAGTCSIYADQAGNSTYGAALKVAQTLTVNPDTLIVSSATANSKTYDGTATDTITGVVLSGVLGSDNVYLTGDTVGTFPGVNAGKNLTVTSYMSLAGTDSANYVLAGQPVLTANIDPLPLIVLGAIADNKVYDGNSNDTITGAYLAGVLGTDDVILVGDTLASFYTLTVGNNIQLNSQMSLWGTSAGNYSISQPLLFANILPLNLTVTGATATNHIYDATTTDTISGATLVGIIQGDDVSLNDTLGTFASDDAGKDISVATNWTLTGNDNANYTLNTQPSGLAANILQRPITITANAASKMKNVADPALTYTITSGTLVGEDALSGSITRQVGEALGEYGIEQGTLTAGPNYKISFDTAIFTIEVNTAVNVATDSKPAVYPNPTSGAITIDADQGNATVVDISGKVILETSVDVNKTIDLSTYSSGVYILILNSDKGTYQYKVIKN